MRRWTVYLAVLLTASACSGGPDAPAADKPSAPTTTTAAAPTATEPTLTEMVANADPVEFLPEPDDLRSDLRRFGFLPVVLDEESNIRAFPYMALFGRFCPDLHWMGGSLKAESASSVVMRTDFAKLEKAQETNPAVPVLTVQVIALFGVSSDDFQDALDEIQVAVGGNASCSADALWVPSALRVWAEDPTGSSYLPFLYDSLPVADRTRKQFGDTLKVLTHANPILVRRMAEDLGESFKRHTSIYTTNVFFDEHLDASLHPEIDRDQVLAFSFGSKHGNMMQRSLFHVPEYEVAIFVRVSAHESSLGKGQWDDLSSDDYDAIFGNLSQLHGVISGSALGKIIIFAG